MSKDKTAVVEIRKGGKLVACVRHCDAVGSSLEVGPDFSVSVRVWFDSMSDTGDLMRDGRMVGVVRANLREPVRKACEAAMWQAHTGDVSALCDGTDTWTDVSYINMGDM